MSHSHFPAFSLQIFYFIFNQNFASPTKQYRGIKYPWIQYPWALTVPIIQKNITSSNKKIVSGASDRSSHWALKTDSLLHHKPLLFTKVLWWGDQWNRFFLLSHRRVFKLDQKASKDEEPVSSLGCFWLIIFAVKHCNLITIFSAFDYRFQTSSFHDFLLCIKWLFQALFSLLRYSHTVNLISSQSSFWLTRQTEL